MVRKRKLEKRNIVVYALVSQLDKRLYVGQCSAESLNRVYRHHINGKYSDTAQLFADSLKAQKLPNVYKLTEYEGYTNKSKIYLYAYMRYFQLQGFRVLLGGEAGEWVKDISIASRQYLDQITNTPVNEILTDDACVIKDYQLKAWSQQAAEAPADEDSAPAHFSVYTTVGQKKLMQERADSCGLSLSEYAEQMMLTGAIVQIDMRELTQRINALYKALYDLGLSIRQYQTVYPGHENELKRIEAEIAAISKQVSQSAEKVVADARREAAKTVRAVARKEGRT